MNLLIDLLFVTFIICVGCCNSPSITEAPIYPYVKDTVIVQDTCKPMPECVDPQPPQPPKVKQ